ncbi:MAG: N-acetyl-gamma-glutamyl-phosphate reductase [Kiritimatiellae bacterium]|nr:N-acetyl-gamma-glutamyl-phosphate reductase [Kiritimatiellia bacterium]
MIKAKIIGAGGYGGIGMTELLLSHPKARIGCLVDVVDVGKKISDLYPHLAGFCDETIVSPDDPKAQAPADVVFFSTPDGVGMKGAAAELKKGSKVIDYSGDFRFNTAEAYADYAGRLGLSTQHASADLLPKAVYGLAELHRNELTRKTQLVGNPGCFAISCILGLAPAAKHKLIDLASIICDCKTGVSGAGKKPAPVFHYPARYDQMNAYRLTGHQHVCEVERELGLLAGTDIKITFTPQVVPTCRGIMSCLYGTLAAGMTIEKVIEAYREFHKENTFVRIFDRSAAIGTVHVRGTNYCNLTVDVDARTNRLRVVSHIDNLVKGQAGNALQNMNLLFGLPETAGLDRPGQYP